MNIAGWLLPLLIVLNPPSATTGDEGQIRFVSPVPKELNDLTLDSLERIAAVMERGEEGARDEARALEATLDPRAMHFTALISYCEDQYPWLPRCAERRVHQGQLIRRAGEEGITAAAVFVQMMCEDIQSEWIKLSFLKDAETGAWCLVGTKGLRR